MALKIDDAKRELLKFLRVQNEVKVLRDKVIKFSFSVLKLQTLYRHWKISKESMISDVTKLWIEEKERIIAHCNKKTSKQKKLLIKKVNAIPPSIQLQITRTFIKRCVYKYHTRYITWQSNTKYLKVHDQIKERVA